MKVCSLEKEVCANSHYKVWILANLANVFTGTKPGSQSTDMQAADISCQLKCLSEVIVKDSTCENQWRYVDW